ncbi:reverse transcriptase [Tanacetum coccineum]
MAKRIGCHIRDTCPLAVTGAYGNKMVTTSECKQFQWQFGSTMFSLDVMLLPLGGCDMVLGIQWLATLGDIRFNFHDLRMDFKYNGRRILLRGTHKSNLEWLNTKTSDKIVRQTELHSMVVCVFPNSAGSFYEDVFATPTELPPRREHDHRIPLMKGAQPVNIKPYRHPPTQKDVIEAMVVELLESGVIKKSNSPFSSPIVMVKKKDNSWRMCVDYRQLNKQTIKDKFPIPIIEELIDELYGSQWFTKLDLSQTVEDHVVHLQTVLDIIRQHTLYAKKRKITAMSQWPIPANLKQLRGFLGLTGYYRRFIKGYASIILRLPNFSKEFTLETDASRVGLGAVLLQEGHPIAFLSKTLSAKHQLMSTYEKEFLAIVYALEKWRGYLLDMYFKIKTDHFSLKYLLDQRMSTPTQLKWLPKLMGFDYEIQYKKGVENVTTDALSRIHWQADTTLKQKIEKLKQGQAVKGSYTWANEELRRKGKLVVVGKEALRHFKVLFLKSKK